MTPTSVKVSLAHVGIWAFDFRMLVQFYVDLFGLVVSDRGQQRDREYAFLTASAQAHHQLVIVSGRVSTTPAAPGGLNQISFQLQTLTELRQLYHRLRELPVTQLVALTHGNAWSVYFHDPENNRVEAFVDTPWHMPQPFAREFDLNLPDEDIHRMTEELCRANPASRPINDWRRWAAAALGEPDDPVDKLE